MRAGRTLNSGGEGGLIWCNAPEEIPSGQSGGCLYKLLNFVHFLEFAHGLTGLVALR